MVLTIFPKHQTASMVEINRQSLHSQ